MSNREPAEEALEMLNGAVFESLKVTFRLLRIPFDEEMLELDFRLLYEDILQIALEDRTQNDVEREVRSFLKRVQVPSSSFELLLQGITTGIWLGLRPSDASLANLENLLDNLGEKWSIGCFIWNDDNNTDEEAFVIESCSSLTS